VPRALLREYLSNFLMFCFEFLDPFSLVIDDNAQRFVCRPCRPPLVAPLTSCPKVSQLVDISSFGSLGDYMLQCSIGSGPRVRISHCLSTPKAFPFLANAQLVKYPLFFVQIAGNIFLCQKKGRKIKGLLNFRNYRIPSVSFGELPFLFFG
jgi:hypothetical protein